MLNLALKDEVATMATGDTWPSYVRVVAAGASRKRIAELAQLNTSVVARWLNGESRPSAENVVAFARSLNRSPVEALLAAGYLEETDIEGSVEVMQSLSDLPDDVLIDELRARLQSRAPQSASDVLGPIPEFGNGAEAGRATQ